jgi:simple sugar transport system permease protein
MALTVPVLWAALGETINERAGVFNVGIEGVMLISAFAAGFGLRYTSSPLLALFFAIVAGALCGAVLSALYITRRADQIVTGILFNLAAAGLTTVLFDSYLAEARTPLTFHSLPVPVLNSIPVVGVLFDQPALGYLAFVMAPVVFFVMRRTWMGLYLNAIGERPLAAEAAGVAVVPLRWLALMAGSMLVGVGGGTLVLDFAGRFVPGMTGGQGFIAIAVVVLCRWNPIAMIGGAALFGLATSLQFALQLMPSLSQVPNEVWLALPYVAAIVAISIAKGSRFPTALGIPYARGGAV